MKRSLVVALAGVLTSVLLVSGTTPAGAAEPSVVSARSWLISQQRSDGGFEVAGFPGFETPDAVLAIAEGGQNGGWNTALALSSVTAATNGGKNPLDALDDYVDAGVNAGQAAKLVSLVIAPLGLDPSDFDPQNDNAAPVDLKALILGAAVDGTYPSLAAAFNGRLYVALALANMKLPIPPALVSVIKGGQQTNGSWNYSGTSAGSDFDADTTGLAIQALVASGVPGSDPTVSKAVASLAVSQRPSGAWGAFGSDDPNSTALAIVGITAAGGNVDNSCWRDKTAPALAGQGYAKPLVWLLSQQQPSGRFASPNDGFGINTFATSQAAQAIGRSWLPIVGSTSISCVGNTPAITGTPAEKFVKSAYLDILARPADKAGLAFHVQRLAAGGRPASVARALTGSREHRNRVLVELYDDYLGTVPTAAELAAADPLLRAGKRFDVQVSILASDEYFDNAGSTNATFVEALYRDLVGRVPDVAGRDRLVASLEAGSSRATIARQVATSGEARSFQVKNLYLRYLRRPGDAGGVEFWRAKLGAGTSVETIVIHFVGSSEYVNRARGL